MPEMKFTPAQENAINAEGGSVIVSAADSVSAAGSVSFTGCCSTGC